MPEVFGNVTATQKVTYSENVKLALQQQESRILQSFSYIPDLKGIQMQAVELIGSSNARRNAAANAATPNIAPKHAGIFVAPERLDWGRSIPSSTPIQNAIDFKSVYVQEGAAAIARGKDAILAESIFGSRLVKNIDDTAPAAVAFDTAAQQIVVNYGGGGNTGLIVTKFVAALSLMIAREIKVENEEIFCLISSKQNEDLYKNLQVTSKDYQNKAVYEDKRVKRFMDVEILTYNALPYQSANIRRVPMYCKSGMHYGDAMELSTQMEKNPAMQYQVHPYMECWIGATRSEDGKVVDILCSEV